MKRLAKACLVILILIGCGASGSDNGIDAQVRVGSPQQGDKNEGENDGNKGDAGVIPLPDEAPQVWIEYPLADELVYGLTRVQVKWQDSDDEYLDLRIFINNMEQSRVETKTLSDPLPKWFEVDFTGFPDGAYTISAEIYSSHGAVVTAEVGVYTDKVEVERRATKFLYDYSSLGSNGLTKQVVRWSSLPIQIEVSPLFTEGQFQIIQKAAEFLYRYTEIPFEVLWSNIETLGISTCAPLPGWFDVHAIYIYPHAPSNRATGSSAATCIKKDPPTTISSVIIDIDPAFLSGNASNPEKVEAVIAHELGHALPVVGHETENYLMKYSCQCYRLSPEMSRAMEKLYFEMKPGDTIPPS